MAAANVADAAVGGLGVGEIVEQHVRAARVGLGIVQHGVDAAGVGIEALLIHLRRHDGALHAPLHVGDARHLLARDVVEDALARQRQQCDIYRVGREAALVGNLRFRDGHIVGKHARVEAQYGRRHALAVAIELVQAVEFVALHQEHQARRVGVLLAIVDIARLRQQVQGAAHLDGKLPEGRAEALHVKLVGHAVAVAQRQLEEVGQVVVGIGDIVFWREGLPDAHEHGAAVSFVVEQHGIGPLAVAPGAARLLVVGFDRVRHLVVHHQADVRFVDAHAEGVGGHHDAHLALRPCALADVLVDGRQAGVEIERLHPRLAEHPGQDGRALTVARIDDGRARHALKDVQQLGVLVVGVAHHVVEVLPGKAHTKDSLTLRAEAQAAADVFYHLRGGRGRQGQDGAVGQQVAQPGDLEVGRTEVVAPLRDTVGLVHGDEGHVHTPHLVLEHLGAETFGRDVEKLVGAEDRIVKMAHVVVVALVGIDGGGAHTAAAEVLHLVLHQRHQRRDDDGHALHGHGRHLEGDALATTRGHEAQRVVTAGDAADDVELDAAETVVAPVALQNVVEAGRLTVGGCRDGRDGRSGRIGRGVGGHGVGRLDGEAMPRRRGGCPQSEVAPRRACGCFPRWRSRCRRRAWS